MHHKFIRRHACDQAPDLPEGPFGLPSTASIFAFIKPHSLRELTRLDLGWGADRPPIRSVLHGGRRLVRIADAINATQALVDSNLWDDISVRRPDLPPDDGFWDTPWVIDGPSGKEALPW
jgi:hypothetical protein